MTANHSTLPFFIYTDNEEDVVKISSNDGEFVAELDSSSDAEFIVRCVNSHDKLVEALKHIMAGCDAPTKEAKQALREIGELE